MRISNKIDSLIHNKKLFVFDFDGVIADSNHIKTEAFKEIFKKYGHQIVQKVQDHHVKNASMTRYEKFRYYHKNFLNTELTELEIKNMGEKFSDIVLDKIIHSPEIKGCKSFLEQLIHLGKKCAINSATPHEEIKTIIEKRKLSDFFEKVYGSPSSKVEILESLMNEYQFNNDDLVFFGDDKSDQLAANKLDILFVGLGKISEESIKKFKNPLNLIENFSGIDLINLKK